MAFSIEEHLFNLYSKNLAENSDLSDEWFICPLCHKVFNRSMLGELSKEHVVPEKLGGKIITLTCEKCNKDFGSKLISKLIKNLDYKDIVSGKSDKPFDAQMTINGRNVTIEYHPGETNKLIPQLERSNPENLAYQNELFEHNEVTEFQLTVKSGYGDEIEQMALLLISYLLLFRYFGYSYAFNYWGRLTRNTIVHEIYDSPLLQFSGGFGNRLLEGKTALLYCQEPQEFANQALIQLNFITENSNHSFIKFLPFLPGTKVDEEAYSKRTKFQFKGFPIVYSEEFLTNPLFRIPPDISIKFIDD